MLNYEDDNNNADGDDNNTDDAVKESYDDDYDDGIVVVVAVQGEHGGEMEAWKIFCGFLLSAQAEVSPCCNSGDPHDFDVDDEGGGDDHVKSFWLCS